jgi:hypothetical protein
VASASVIVTTSSGARAATSRIRSMIRARSGRTTLNRATASSLADFLA